VNIRLWRAGLMGRMQSMAAAVFALAILLPAHAAVNSNGVDNSVILTVGTYTLMGDSELDAVVNVNAAFALTNVSGALQSRPCAGGGTYIVTASWRNTSGTHYYGMISAQVVTLTGGNVLASQSFTLPANNIVGPNQQMTGVFNITLASCNRFTFIIDLLGEECAIPVNYRQVGRGTDIGGGTLHFDYRWDSSTGGLDDLAVCSVG
jgi:hypothetical protein